MTDQAPEAESDIPGKPTSASRTTLSHIMTHNDTNLLGTVHGDAALPERWVSRLEGRDTIVELADDFTTQFTGGRLDHGKYPGC